MAVEENRGTVGVASRGVHGRSATAVGLNEPSSAAAGGGADDNARAAGRRGGGAAAAAPPVALPETPQLAPQGDGIGRVIWSLLYPPAVRRAPPLVGVVVRRDGRIAIVEHPPAAAQRGGPPSEETLRAAAAGLRPLRGLTDLYQDDVMLLVAPHGATFIVRPDVGASMVLIGQTPADPRLPQARINPLLYRLWLVGDGFVKTGHPLIAGVGAVAAVTLWLATAVFAALWVSEIVPRLASALAAWPVTSDWHPWLRYGFSLAVNAVEAIGLLLVLDRSTRIIGGALAAIEIPFHMWYGIQSAAHLDPPGRALAALTGAATAVLPEALLALLVVLAVRLTPLVPSSALHLAHGVREMGEVWRTLASRYARPDDDPDDDPLEAQTVILPDGTVRTFYVRPVRPACEEES